MRELPILFGAPMVRAIQDGTKTQTRRLVKPQPFAQPEHNDETGEFDVYAGDELSGSMRCPYGQPDDRLWVREAFADLHGTGIEHRQPPDFALQRYAYAADTRPGSASDEARKDYGIRWKPSIHMPRAASRITLEVTGVRVERLQAISEADALAEGIQLLNGWHTFNGGLHQSRTAEESFSALWESLNGAGSWDANPRVWVISFRRVDAAEGGDHG
ncbi:hypothetical protein [Lysobacter enzymogenes]|uniref:hypothetical protein n=1 Tax=Lysobacter enzymogenes TaxID=69 RepID=UPI00099E0EEC|nr:hypothetical protein [Lysobacter enzymogenes]UZW62715.1 hypothetical protein BV903_010670 [Lysobacter enzymogenes]